MCLADRSRALSATTAKRGRQTAGLDVGNTALLFIGGAAGMAPLIACAGLFLGQLDLMRGALWIAAAGAIISPVLLVMDLGRPMLFFNMLRVFKYRSPMSVGAWILSVFGAFAVPAWLVLELYANEAFAPSVAPLVLPVAGALTVGAAIPGLGLATYTGVLLGATAIRVIVQTRRARIVRAGADTCNQVAA
jgi:formate-dependent nitrite reductase membrane component NrfD